MRQHRRSGTRNQHSAIGSTGVSGGRSVSPGVCDRSRVLPADYSCWARGALSRLAAASLEDVLARTGNAKVRTVSSRLALGRRAGAISPKSTGPRHAERTTRSGVARVPFPFEAEARSSAPVGPPLLAADDSSVAGYCCLGQADTMPEGQLAVVKDEHCCIRGALQKSPGARTATPSLRGDCGRRSVGRSGSERGGTSCLLSLKAGALSKRPSPRPHDRARRSNSQRFRRCAAAPAQKQPPAAVESTRLLCQGLRAGGSALSAFSRWTTCDRLRARRQETPASLREQQHVLAEVDVASKRRHAVSRSQPGP
jgi:hypothetical protein